jgi:hypothetical protein
MFRIDVETVSIEGLKEIVDTRIFSDEGEFDQLIMDFISKQVSNAQKQLEEKYDRIIKTQKALEKIEFTKDYNNTMEMIDEIILCRQQYLDKIEKKYRYKGRYHYDNHKTKDIENTVGSSRNSKIEVSKRCDSGQQLRLMP